MASFTRYLKIGELLNILKRLYENQDTGTLVLQKESVTKFLYIQEGQVIFAASNAPEDKFTQILIEQGKLTPEQLALAQEKRSGRTIGKTLVELGFIGSEDLLDSLVEQVHKIASSVVAWSSGQSSFKANILPPGVAKLPIGTPRLIVDTVLSLEDRSWIGKTLGGLESAFQMSPSEKDTARALPATAEESRILEHLSGKIRLSEVFEKAGVDDFLGSRFLLGLFYLGLIHRKEILTQVRDDRETEDVVDLSFLDEVVPTPTPSFGSRKGEGAGAPDVEATTPSGEGGPAALEIEEAVEKGFSEEESFDLVESDGVPEAPSFAEPEGEPFRVGEPASAEESSSEEPAPSGLDEEPDYEEPAPSGGFRDEMIPGEAPPPPGGLRFRPEQEGRDQILSPGAGDLIIAPSAEEMRGEAPDAGPEAPAGKPPGAPGRKHRQTKTRRGLWAGLAAALFLLVIAAAGGWYLWPSLRPLLGGETEATGGEAPSPQARPTPEPAPSEQATEPDAAGEPAAASSEPGVPQPERAELPQNVPADAGVPGSQTPPPTGVPARELMLQGRYREAAQAFRREFRPVRGGYTIDLEVACQGSTIEKGLAAAAGDEAFAVLPYDFRGRPCFRVIWGHYETREEAEAALRSLPAFFLSEASPKVSRWVSP